MPYIKLRSKNPSASDLRTRLASVRTKNPFVVRLGSRVPLSTYTNPLYRRSEEINTIESIENSRNKLRMKACFTNEEVSQAAWGTFSEFDRALITFPCVVKQVCGFKGHGMVKCESQEELNTWLANHSTNGYYWEAFKNWNTEYRLHATQERVFLSWRKLRRADAEQRWFFNSTNCNWVSEEHELFDKPRAWDLMCEHAVRAIRATGLSIGAVDVRCKSNCNNEEDFIILECNSAPEIGVVGTESYFNEIVTIIKAKDDGK